jgi:Zn-finger nucleic acid-binding protein
MFKKEQTRRGIGMSKMKWLAPLLDLQLYEREREAVKGFIKMRWKKREMKARLKWLDKKISLLSTRVEIDCFPSILQSKSPVYAKLYLQAIEAYGTANLTLEELENATEIARGTWKRNRHKLEVLHLALNGTLKKANLAKTDKKKKFWYDRYSEVDEIMHKSPKSRRPKTVPYSDEKRYKYTIADLMSDEQNRYTDGKTPKRRGANLDED